MQCSGLPGAVRTLLGTEIPVRIGQIGIYIILAAMGEGCLAEDRVQWRALVSSLSSLRVAYETVGSVRG